MACRVHGCVGVRADRRGASRRSAGGGRSASAAPTDDLESAAAALGQHQRRLEVSSSRRPQPTCVAGAQRQLDEGGAGQQHGAADGVVGQPGVGAQREPAGEDDPVGVGQRDGGAEQRVAGGAQPAPVSVAAAGAGVRASSARAGRRRWAGRPARAARGGAGRPVDRRRRARGRRARAASSGLGLGPVLAQRGATTASASLGQAVRRQRGQARRPGPISRKVVDARAVRDATPSAKRTASRTCRTQYSAVASARRRAGRRSRWRRPGSSAAW